MRVKTNKRMVSLLCYISLLLALTFSMGISTSVFADRSDVDSVVNIGEGQGAVASICARANDVSGTDILVYTGNDGILSFSNKLYAELDMETKRQFMETALKTTKESSLGTQAKNKVYNFIEKQDETTSAAVKYLKSDASADFAEARAWFRPFSSGFGVVMGVMCLLIFMFLGASIVFDLCYLLIPGVQLLLERGKSNERPVGVSREAWKTQQDLERKTEYENALTIYLKRRVGIIFVCSLCLGYVISGKIYDVIVFFIDVFTSV